MANEQDIAVLSQYDPKIRHLVMTNFHLAHMSCETIEMLMKEGCDPNRSVHGVTRIKVPLIFELPKTSHCLEKLEILIRYGTDVNIKEGFYGNTLLQDITWHGGWIRHRHQLNDINDALDVMQLLLDNGADIHAINNDNDDVFQIIRNNLFHLKYDENCHCKYLPEPCLTCEDMERYRILRRFLKGYIKKNMSFFELMIRKFDIRK